MEDARIDLFVEIYLARWFDAVEALNARVGPRSSVLDALGAYAALERFDEDRLRRVLRDQGIEDRIPWDQEEALAEWGVSFAEAVRSFSAYRWEKDFRTFQYRRGEVDPVDRADWAIHLFMKLDHILCIYPQVRRNLGEEITELVLINISDVLHVNRTPLYIRTLAEEAPDFLLGVSAAMDQHIPADLIWATDVFARFANEAASKKEVQHDAI